MNKVNIAEKFGLIQQYWSPRVIAQLNGQEVKAGKFKGEFVWHFHEQQDEMFLVVQGRFRMDFRERSVWVEQGELIVVPMGVEHRPYAEEEVHVLLFEPAGTLNTGNVRNELTIDTPASL